MKRIIISILTLAVLTGCGVYRKYPMAEDVDRNLFGGENISGDTASVAALSWRELFQDDFLRRLIDTALVRNTDLNMARLRARQAESALLAARLSYLPSVNIGAEGGLGRWDGQTSGTYSISGSASWEIDIFGKLTAAKREARASLEKSYAYRQAVQTSLISSVATSYYTLLMLDERIKVSEESLRSWERTVSTLRSLMRAGNSNEVAVLQAEANKAALEASLLSMRKNLKEAENTMCLLLAQNPESIERGKLENQVFPDSLSIGIPARLLANRPDVREAEMALAKAFYATDVARSAFYPSISLSGSAGWTNNGGGIVINPGQWLLNAIGSLTQPLFNRGANIANLETAVAEQEIAALAFRQKLLEAGSEVNNAMAALQTSRERLEIDARGEASLQEAVRKTELLMRHSSVNYLEVLTAQQSLLEVRQSLVQDKFDEIQSIINLYHALGGGE